MKKLLIQALHFFGLSGIGWILDFCTFILLGFISNNLILNNTISSWVGVTFVFCTATRHVFKNNDRISLKWKYVIYLLYQIVLIYGISELLNFIKDLLIVYCGSFTSVAAKIIVTPVTMSLNFLIMKCIIEKL